MAHVNLPARPARTPTTHQKDIKYYPWNTTTTTITTSPMRYNKARLAKSDDNNETYDVTLQESTITMPQFITNDLDDQYQKEDENDIQCTLDTTSISTTTSSSPTRYDVQGIDNRNK
eukprot:scaffold36943_cov61-Attheya_sp.AAC.4